MLVNIFMKIRNAMNSGRMRLSVNSIKNLLPFLYLKQICFKYNHTRKIIKNVAIRKMRSPRTLGLARFSTSLSRLTSQSAMLDLEARTTHMCSL